MLDSTERGLLEAHKNIDKLDERLAFVEGAIKSIQLILSQVVIVQNKLSNINNKLIEKIEKSE